MNNKKYQSDFQAFLENSNRNELVGFPIGETEAVLSSSTPPYYSNSPNPFINTLLEKWEVERNKIHEDLGIHTKTNGYRRKPYASDISEGKSDPVYNAVSYHTKVPYKAIIHYILNYTDPGDIVFDGFSGSGMTGVAAQMCDDKNTLINLGYIIKENNIISRSHDDQNFIQGPRKAILNDLSPSANLISYSINNVTKSEMDEFSQQFSALLNEVEGEINWIYQTWYPDIKSKDKTKRKFTRAVWSDLFTCPECGQNMTFWDVAVDKEKMKIIDQWPCPNCKTLLSKESKKGSSITKAERVFETIYDPFLNETIVQGKQKMVFIQYKFGNKLVNKEPDSWDLEIFDEIYKYLRDMPIPIIRMPDGDESRRNDRSGITHIHHFYTPRNLFALIKIYEKSKKKFAHNNTFTLLWKVIFQSASVTLCSKLSRYNLGRRGNGPVSGTLYIASLISEENVLDKIRRKLSDLTRGINSLNSRRGYNIISTSSSTSLNIPSNAIDYIFVDPPFGGNLMYSELNFLWESWLGVYTNTETEAIVNHTHKKGLFEYQSLMVSCFKEFYRVLKPGKWMTVEFHNSQNTVWNAIQEALGRAGFIVADIRTLDKKQGTFKQLNTNSAVKQDLIISVYKPTITFENNFKVNAGTHEGVWDFVREHLESIPNIIEKDGLIELMQERTPILLFDRMIAYHIQKGYSIPLSSSEFYSGLQEKFPRRDGMYFLPDQVGEYDRVRLKISKISQLSLFVSDEKTSIQWLRRELDKEIGGSPQTYQELQPKFLQQLQQARHEQLPELMEILEQNFLKDEKGRWYTPVSNKASDLEKIRNRALFREFSKYNEGKGRLKQFRTEAVLAGFANAWQSKDFETIVKVANRLPEAVLHEDPDLLMYYDNASLRVD